MSLTHHTTQTRTPCPRESCGRTIRLKPASKVSDDEAYVICGDCGQKFHADRETGEVTHTE